MTLKKFLAMALCLCMVLGTMSFTVFAETTTLSGSGTEEEPFMINSVEDLLFFRDSVNAGETTYNESGKWVALGADIDLNGSATWTEGIGDGHEWSFDGNFDGKGHSIKNLVVTPYADSENPETAYICGGLFGYIYGGVTIKNIVLENVTVATEDAGHNVGALVGFANNKDGKANISDITVKGKVIVDVPNAYGVGTIVGYSYRDMGTIADCAVDADDDSYIKGHSFVGGITGYSYTNAVISDCSVNNIDITGTGYSVGGIAGLATTGVKVEGCEVAGVEVNGQANVGSILGAVAGDNIFVEDCTTDIDASLVGGNYEDNTPVVAFVNGKYYTSLQAALDAVVKGDNTITLLTDVEENVIVHQSEGINIIIDGAGNEFDGIIDIYGHARYDGAETLTIQNVNFVTDAKKDFITCNTTDSEKRYAHNVTVKDCTFTANNDTYDVVAMRFRQCFDIKVENCSFEGLHSAMQATGGGEALVLDNITVEGCKNGISTGTSANVVVKNSTIETVGESSYGVRTDASGAYSLSVEACEIDAFTPVQARKATSPDYSLTVTDSTLEASNPFGYAIVVADDEYEAGADEIDFADVNINLTLDKAYSITAYVAITDGKAYTSIEDAIAAISDNSSVTVFGGTYDAALTINKKNVTVIGNGEVLFTKAPTFKGTDYYVEGIDFEYANGSGNLGGTGKFVDCGFTANENTFRYCYAKGGTIEFERCVLTAENMAGNTGWAIHFDQSGGLDLVLTNSSITGKVALAGDLGSLTATGTDFNDYYVNIWGTEDGAVFENCEFNNIPYIFTGYDLDNTVKFVNCTTDNEDGIAGLIYGGIDNAEAEIHVDGAVLTRVAKIGDVYYQTIEDAIAAAGAGDTIEILAGTYDAFNVPENLNNITFIGATDAEGNNLVTIRTLEEGLTTNTGGIFVQPETATFKNLNITAGTTAYNGGWMTSSLGNTNGETGKGSKSSLKQLNVENVNFTGSGKHSAIWMNSGSVNFVNSTVDNYQYGVYVYAINDGQLVNVTGSELSTTNRVVFNQEGSVNGKVNVTDSVIDAPMLTVGAGVPATLTGNYIDGVTFYIYGVTDMRDNALVDCTYSTGGAGEITLAENYVNNVNDIVDRTFVRNINFESYYRTEEDLANKTNLVEVEEKANKVYVQYRKIDSEEGTDKYEIVLVGADDVEIHELASADLTFDFEGTLLNGADMTYAVEAAEGVSVTRLGDRYLFNYNGVDKYEDSGVKLVIGTITIEGYGSYTLRTDEEAANAVYATKIADNIVEGFTPAAKLVINAEIADDDDMVGKITDGVIAVPVRDLAINIDFPNAVANQKKAYQDMKVVISGGDLKENIEIELGNDWEETLDLAGKTKAAIAVDYTDNEYVINVTDALTLNNAYTVTVSGAGYRTARYTVTMTKDKELNFWNNVMDKETVVEKDEFKTTKNFLAGDIVKDNNINIYDLSAVVSYFGTEDCVNNYPEYAKYDLNRDGVIDSRDVAYVLVSWGE